MQILEEKGYMVTGLDLSNDMLDIAKTRVKGNLFQQDMRDIQINQQFDAVVCLGSSFTYMQSDEDVEKALHSFYNHLEPGGVLLFDNFDYDRFSPERHGKWEETSHSFDDSEIIRRSKSGNWNPLDGTWTTEWEWTITDENGANKIQDSHKLKAYRFSYMKEKLQEAGFKDIEKIENRRLLIKAEKG